MISIIVPVYNVENYLRQCIDSILVQTYEDWELLLVDDGATDASGQICDEYAQRDLRIKVLHKKNGGLSDARNAGLDAAQGEWRLFVDSDDSITPTCLETMLAAAQENGADMVLAAVQRTDMEGVPQDEYGHPSKSGVFVGKDLLQQLFLGCCTYYIIACAKLSAAKLWKTRRFPVKTLHEDEAVTHHLLGNSLTVVCLDDALYLYRRNPQSISVLDCTPQNPQEFDINKILLERYRYITDEIKDMAVADLALRSWWEVYVRNTLYVLKHRPPGCLPRAKQQVSALRRLFWPLMQSRQLTLGDKWTIALSFVNGQLGSWWYAGHQKRRQRREAQENATQ